MFVFFGEFVVDVFDGGVVLLIVFELLNGIVFDMMGEQYVCDWVLLQFYFYVIVVYVILCYYGVEFGKVDYVLYMFVYVWFGMIL